jgi:hypothetical protein
MWLVLSCIMCVCEKERERERGVFARMKNFERVGTLLTISVKTSRGTKSDSVDEAMKAPAAFMSISNSLSALIDCGVNVASVFNCNDKRRHDVSKALSVVSKSAIQSILLVIVDNGSRQRLTDIMVMIINYEYRNTQPLQ